MTRERFWVLSINMRAEIFLLLAVLCSASMAIALKTFRAGDGNRYGIILGNYVTCIIISLVMMGDVTAIARTDTATLLCGIIGGVLFVAGLVTMQSSIGSNGAILTSAFAKMGLVVPLSVSILFLGERPGLIQIPGLILVLIAVWIIGGAGAGGSREDKKKTAGAGLILLLLVLLAYGSADAMVKLFETAGPKEQDALFFFWIFAVAAVFTLILFLREKKLTGAKTDLKSFAAGMLTGVPNYFSSALLLKSLAGIPAFVAYPFYSTGSLLIVTIVGAAVFKERIGKRAGIGILVVCAALILLNIT